MVGLCPHLGALPVWPDALRFIGWFRRQEMRLHTAIVLFEQLPRCRNTLASTLNAVTTQGAHAPNGTMSFLKACSFYTTSMVWTGSWKKKNPTGLQHQTASTAGTKERLKVTQFKSIRTSWYIFQPTYASPPLRTKVKHSLGQGEQTQHWETGVPVVSSTSPAALTSRPTSSCH